MKLSIVNKVYSLKIQLRKFQDLKITKLNFSGFISVRSDFYFLPVALKFVRLNIKNSLKHVQNIFLIFFKILSYHNYIFQQVATIIATIISGIDSDLALGTVSKYISESFKI